MSKEVDQELLRRYQAVEGGDPAAAEQLITRQMDRIYAICLSIVRQPEVAAELAQEALLRLFASLPRYRGECSWSTWTFRVARNLSLNWREKMREDFGDDGHRLEARGGGPLELSGRRERIAGVRAVLLDALSEVEREAILLHYEAGLSVIEVTELMGLDNKSGARGVLQRARRKLRQGFKEQMPEDSVVQRAFAPEPVRQAMERTLHDLTRGAGRDLGSEPELRPMRGRTRLLD